MKKYIDSGVFIQAVLRNNKPCIEILRKIINKEITGVTSILSWDELVFIIKKFIDHETAIREGERFLRFPNLNFIDAKKEIIIKAQKLVEKYKINPRDAIHAATAINSGVKEIVTEDKDFDNIIELKRKIP